MSLKWPVWVEARRALLAAAVVVISCVAAIVGVRYGLEQSQARLYQAQAELQTQQAKLADKVREMHFMQANGARFEQLRRGGLMGPADRALWVEQLLASRQRLGLPDTLSYTLQPPQALTTGDPAPNGSSATPSRAQYHDLDFSLRAIHEVELLDFLNDYAAHVPARWRVHACVLGDPSPAGLTAHCSLRFFSVSAG